MYSTFGNVLISLFRTSEPYRLILPFFDEAIRPFLLHVFFESNGHVTVILPLLVLFLAYEKNAGKLNTFYGLHVQNIDILPYIIISLSMLPLAFAASFLPSFADSYPRYDALLGNIFATE
jgi:hypothetical protein